MTRAVLAGASAATGVTPDEPPATPEPAAIVAVTNTAATTGGLYPALIKTMTILTSPNWIPEARGIEGLTDHLVAIRINTVGVTSEAGPTVRRFLRTLA